MIWIQIWENFEYSEIRPKMGCGVHKTRTVCDEPKSSSQLAEQFFNPIFTPLCSLQEREPNERVALQADRYEEYTETITDREMLEQTNKSYACFCLDIDLWTWILGTDCWLNKIDRQYINK